MKFKEKKDIILLISVFMVIVGLALFFIDYLIYAIALLLFAFIYIIIYPVLKGDNELEFYGEMNE